ncbi:MAG: hypothetical protein PHQ60_10105 [Sideroxydans sp.]|nr:hypothetical protein [Sideroxydans sp.]
MTHQFKHPKHYLFPLVVWLFAGFNHAALADLPPVVVKTWGEHVGGNIVYHHQVTNNSSRDVWRVAIGLDTDNPGNEQPFTREQGELNFVMPIGMEPFQRKINPPLISGPTGWAGEMIQIEHAGKFLQWYSPPSPQTPLLPGQTLRFSVTVPAKIDDAYLIKHFSVRLSELSSIPSGAAYLTGHFSVDFPIDGGPELYNGTMEKIDNTPPTLLVTLSPNTLFPPNEKLIPITATITVKDDYDPEPEIKLESITANEKLEAEDIQDATIGTDDRQFQLRAERRGERDNRDGRERDDRRNDKDTAAVPTGRIYTVTYSATDASGNKSTATATVTVPHDQRENDRGDKDKGDGKDKRER